MSKIPAPPCAEHGAEHDPPLPPPILCGVQLMVLVRIDGSATAEYIAYGRDLTETDYQADDGHLGELRGAVAAAMRRVAAFVATRSTAPAGGKGGGQ